MRSRRVACSALALSLLALVAGGTAAEARTYKVGEYKLSKSRTTALRSDWVNQIQRRYPEGTWAPMRYELSNRDLRLMGLPSKRVLLSHNYRRPTAFLPSGRMLRLPTRYRTAAGKTGGGKS